jgi:putative endonuclease
MAARHGALPENYRRWNYWRRWFGQRSERAAAAFLRSLGYRILGVNIADTLGELDLLALDGRTLVFVEVRSTSSSDPHLAAQSVNYPKQKRLTSAALRFLTRRRLLGEQYRFDVIAIAWPDPNAKPILWHIPNAFAPTDRHQMFS